MLSTKVDQKRLRTCVLEYNVFFMSTGCVDTLDSEWHTASTFGNLGRTTTGTGNKGLQQ